MRGTVPAALSWLIQHVQGQAGGPPRPLGYTGQESLLTALSRYLTRGTPAVCATGCRRYWRWRSRARTGACSNDWACCQHEYPKDPGLACPWRLTSQRSRHQSPSGSRRDEGVAVGNRVGCGDTVVV